MTAGALAILGTTDPSRRNQQLRAGDATDICTQVGKLASANVLRDASIRLTLSAFEPSSNPCELALKRLQFCRSEDQLSDFGWLADAVQQSLVCVLKMLSCFLLSELTVACDER